MSREPALIVAIDGPSGVGKTTVARGVAKRLGIPYLETGAMYRALGLRVLELGVDPDDEAAVAAVAASLDLGYRLASGGGIVILLDGAPVGEAIRAPRVSEATSRLAVHPAVRRRMVDLQRRWARVRGAVMEGRDIGTKVFPDTPHKFFLDALPDVRMERRLRQLRELGRELDVAEVRAEMSERDRRDSGRTSSPLTRDASYRGIDTSDRPAAEVIDEIVAEVERRRAAELKRGG